MLRFLVKAEDLETDKERMDACMSDATDAAKETIRDAESVSVGADEGREAEVEQAQEVVERVFKGIDWAVSNPREFNNAFNNWLPRVMFFMTPVLALILALFLRRDSFVFDHMVLSLYVHAVNFAIVALSLILAQLGAPQVGAVGFLVVVVYYVMALKRAYGRGWIKTIWTAFASGLLYVTIFMTILLAIVSRVVWQAAA
jgi:hypothetical protein